MLACNESRDNMSFRRSSGDKVVFKNVQKRYKFPDIVTVEYILSPKIKTSTHDYVGIYPRNWKDLKEFVGFEHPIPAPFEEPNLYRCLQFSCQPSHVKAVLHQDYQFVYVDQSQEILGKSEFFQFVEEIDNSYTSAQENHDWYNTDSCWQEDNITTQTLENADIKLTPYEIAYNKCFFRSQNNGTNYSKFLGTAELACGSSDETCSAYFATPETSQSYLMSAQQKGVLKENFKLNEQKRGRALIKTRDDAYVDCRGNGPGPEVVSRNFVPYMKDQGINTGPDLTYSQNWLQSKKSTDKPISSSNRSDINRGAVPKKCSKCHAPSDYKYRQELSHHECVMASLQIRDLKSELEKVKNDLQLSQAAHAKLKVLAGIANSNCSDAVTFLNNLMMSLITQDKTRVVNYDGSVMYVTREIVSPGWLINRSQQRTLICRRPNVRVINGRDKLLKAIIGRQEEKIRDLHAKLCGARQVIEQANLMNPKLLLDLSGDEKTAEGGASPKDTDSAVFDLANIEKTISTLDKSHEEEHMEGGKMQCIALVHNPGNMEEDKLPTPTLEEVNGQWNDSLVVEPKYYSLDPMQSMNREIISDEDHIFVVNSENEDEDSLLVSEANNNNYDTKNRNSLSFQGGEEEPWEPKHEIFCSISPDTLDIKPEFSAKDCN